MKGGNNMKKNRPLQEQIDDFSAWFEDLEEDEKAHIETIPDIVWDLLPDFISKWSVSILCDIIRSQ